MISPSVCPGQPQSDDPCFKHAHTTHGPEETSHGIRIKLPDALFASIMSVKPEINPMYRASKVLSDDWLRNALKMDEKSASEWNSLDIAYMTSIGAPGADIETLKLLNDWYGWVFAFDDPFDEGNYANDPIKAAEEVISMIAILDDVHPLVPAEENPLRHTLQSCWIRFREKSSPNLQYRWKQHLITYCVGVLRQVGVQHSALNLTVEEYMDMRAGCVGIYPCIGLMEYAEGIDLPPNVVDHPCLSTISRVTCDLATLQNDLCSYNKELVKGEDTNIMLILKNRGMSNQQAADHIGEMLHDCYQRWNESIHNLPSWGETLDRDVMKFVTGCRNLALGNLHWSFYTPRYMGNKGADIRRTMTIELPEVGQ